MNNETHKLSEYELDVLKEIMNIASGRAAAALSGIVRRRIVLSLVDLYVVDRDGIFDVMENELGLIGSVVVQRFDGGINGISMVVMKNQIADEIIKEIAEDIDNDAIEHVEKQSILSEIGNIILNSCVGIIAKQAEERVRFTLPQVYFNLVGRRIAEDIVSPIDPSLSAIVLKSHLEIGNTRVPLYILIFLILSIESLKRILGKSHLG